MDEADLCMHQYFSSLRIRVVEQILGKVCAPPLRLSAEHCPAPRFSESARSHSFEGGKQNAERWLGKSAARRLRLVEPGFG